MPATQEKVEICHNITGALGGEELPEILSVKEVGTEALWQPSGLKKTASGFIAHRPTNGMICCRASSCDTLRKISQDKKAMQKDHDLVLRLHGEDDDKPVWTVTLKVRFLSITLEWPGDGKPPMEVARFTAETVQY